MVVWCVYVVVTGGVVSSFNGKSRTNDWGSKSYQRIDILEETGWEWNIYSLTPGTKNFGCTWV